MKLFNKRCVLYTLSLLFLFTFVPLRAGAESIEGVWRIASSGNPATVNYKVLKKNGKYINLRSHDGGKTFSVTRKGLYEIVAPGVYVENLKYENGGWCNVLFPISYQKEKNKLHLTFKLNGRTYTEVWEKVKSSAYRQP